MHIVFVTPQEPSPVGAGAAIRNWHLIRAATEGGHQTHVLTFDHPAKVGAETAKSAIVPVSTRSHTRRVRDLIGPQPDLALRVGSARLRERLATLVRCSGADLVQIEGLEMWPTLGPLPVRAIYDAHNAEAALQRDMARQAWQDRDPLRAGYSWYQARKLVRYEAAALRRAVTTLAVSGDDRDDLHTIAPDATIDTVPIGVDTGYFDRTAADIGIPRRSDVVFSGTLDYRANRDAAQWMLTDIWPRIRSARPAATLALVGRNPPQAIRRFDGRDGVTVTGSVPDDRPYMAGAAVYALPIRIAAGVRVKLLNALSMSCPVVATPAACRGVAIRNGEHLMQAPAEENVFAAAILRLLADPAHGRALGVTGRRLMCDTFDWRCIAPKLLAVYARLERGGA